MTLKVGIAGYGIVGERRRKCVDNHPRMRVVAVCDRKFGGDGKFEDGIQFYKNYHRLLEEELDVLIVCMTNDMAPEVTIAALNRGLHVFCEKPPGRTVEDIARVIQCEKSHSGLKLMYGFNHRYHESVQDATRLIRSGRFGEILNLRGVYGKSQLVTFNQTDWRTKRQISGGGVLLDQGIHMVDLMRLFAGEFKDVYSFVSNGYWGYDVEDNAYALMRTSKGVVAMLHSSATIWRHHFDLQITLETGAIILSGILSGSKSYGAETLTVIWANPDSDNGNPKEQTTRYNYDPSWQSEVDTFADCILKNNSIEYGSSQDALATMQLVYKIYCADPAWRDKYNLNSSVLVNKSR